MNIKQYLIEMYTAQANEHARLADFYRTPRNAANIMSMGMRRLSIREHQDAAQRYMQAVVAQQQ